ncbi:hypothetical protein MAMC_00619 [Methylacidimicrobium cyclopophantes]|uniref:Uncharacterized protein n=1 Tax=Methylacidimicrobium cyclopophantes TaxID=1041766 RepID=A0A5E6M8C5_9BACT|nr:hypothetical protein MAMC_00619 [Methylacidimicrobium cyclopophantes]
MRLVPEGASKPLLPFRVHRDPHAERMGKASKTEGASFLRGCTANVDRLTKIRGDASCRENGASPRSKAEHGGADARAKHCRIGCGCQQLQGVVVGRKSHWKKGSGVGIQTPLESGTSIGQFIPKTPYGHSIPRPDRPTHGPRSKVGRGSWGKAPVLRYPPPEGRSGAAARAALYPAAQRVGRQRVDEKVLLAYATLRPIPDRR